MSKRPCTSYPVTSILLALLLGFLAAGSAQGSADANTWIEKSDSNAEILLAIMARYAPEGAAGLGVPGLDEEVLRVSHERDAARLRDAEQAVAELRGRLAEESHAKVRQDLELLIAASERNVRGTRLTQELLLPYFDLVQVVFQGIRALLNDQIAADRRPAALARLSRYAGLEDGYTPIAQQVEEYIRARLAEPELMAPFKGQVEQDLANAETIISGLGSLFGSYGIAGYEPAYEVLSRQLGDYLEFVRAEILPRARDDFRQPPELYAFSLERLGVDMPVEELVSRAKVAFREIQIEMESLSALIARQRGLPSSDYRDVIRALKAEVFVGEAILPHYRQRIEELEGIIAREGIVSLPEREMVIRLASAAESSALPAPHLIPPRLIGNSGELAEFVLPLRIPSTGEQEAMDIDDFAFEAVSWTMAVHEGRPGHELQFSALVEGGVSRARALFAFNSVNVEGWALYAEAEMKPYLPLEGQLISLQLRLQRAARAFLDPGLNLGTLSREEAVRVLERDVVLSPAMVKQEIDRYTFRDPGQATSYFCGYLRLMELRADAERLLGSRFDRRLFHDFILAQGLLPPSLLRDAVLGELAGAP